MSSEGEFITAGAHPLPISEIQKKECCVEPCSTAKTSIYASCNTNKHLNVFPAMSVMWKYLSEDHPLQLFDNIEYELEDYQFY